MKPNPIRVLVVDDSASMRALIARLLSDQGAIEIVGEAGDGASAIELAERLRPDVITMDVNMPKMDGISAVRAIMESAPTRILVVCESSRTEQAELSYRAVEAGALELIRKPRPKNSEELEAWGRELRAATRAMSQVPVVSRRRRTSADSSKVAVSSKIDIIGIVASTGGPPALASLLAGFGPSLGVPIVIAQHTGVGFTTGLASWLSHASGRPVRLAENGERCVAGVAYLPPDGCHLEVFPAGVFKLEKVASTERVTLCPSGTRLFASLAKSYGSRAAGIVLTGMGEDGAEGLLALKRSGAVTFVQEPDSCVVSGMPRAAIERGAAHYVLPLDVMALVLRGISSCG